MNDVNLNTDRLFIVRNIKYVILYVNQNRSIMHRYTATAVTIMYLLT